MIEGCAKSVVVDATPPGMGSRWESSPVLHRRSGVVWCRKRGRRATVAAIERKTPTGSFRYVQWCSLIGIDVDCDQRCLDCLATAAETEET
jgi:hypothetical protein